MRRIWLVNPSFQVKYITAIVVLVVGIIGALGYMYASLLKQEQQLIGINAMVKTTHLSKMDREFDRELKQGLIQDSKRQILTMIGVSVVLVLLLGLVALKATHKIAGPVYVASKTIRAMAMGRLNAVRPLRKGDEFTFMFEDLKALQDFLHSRINREIEDLERILETLEAIKVCTDGDREVIEELKSLLRNSIQEKRMLLDSKEGEKNG